MKTKNSGKSSGNFGQKQWEIRAKVIGNSEKSNRKFGQKQREIREKAMENLDKSNNFCPQCMPPLSEFSHCFFPN